MSIPYFTITYMTALGDPLVDPPVDVGDYRIKAVYGGNAVAYFAPGEDTDNFSILPAKPIIVLKNKKAIYTGTRFRSA